jgi:predicted acetyltransferase
VSVSVGAPSGEDELRALAETHNRTYARSAEDGERWLKRVNAPDVRVVRTGGEVAGGLVLLPMGQWFGGRSVPMTGIGSVGIDPEHRASGLGARLMRDVLEEIHAAGAPLSTLYPATHEVYRRVGYELAGSWIVHRMPVAVVEVRDRELEMLRVDDPAVVRPLYAERARRGAGNLDRSDRFWEHALSSEPEDMHIYLVHRDGTREGYCAFRQVRGPDSFKYDLRLRDVVALTGSAARRLWTFFAEHRSFANDVVWVAGPADPMVYAVREPLWRVDRAWNWMLRIVDVRGALGSRGYPAAASGELHLEVRDDVLGWNDGRFVLEVSGGAGKVRKGGRGRLRIDVRGLASLYTGFLGPRELQATGYLDAASDRDSDTAASLFGGPAPWLADFF